MAWGAKLVDAQVQKRSDPAHNVNIIQIFTPTTDHSDKVVETFLEQLQTTVNLTKRAEITIIMDEFNAKISSSAREDIVGGHVVVSNTLLKLPPIRLYTWTSNPHKPGRMVFCRASWTTTKSYYRRRFCSTSHNELAPNPVEVLSAAGDHDVLPESDGLCNLTTIPSIPETVSPKGVGLNLRKNTYYEKAFDKMQHEKLRKTLIYVGLDDRDLKTVSNLYWNQTVQLKVQGQQIEHVVYRRMLKISWMDSVGNVDVLKKQKLKYFERSKRTRHLEEEKKKKETYPAKS
ncbi:hypothetical protein HUJ04_006971 [Dendroctonus ponderosae]|nr:hypothetical protein HUJ04_006971 [Dendroctonus ponderosae]